MPLEGTPAIQPQAPEQTCSTQNVVQADTGRQDGCDVFGRIKSLTVQRGLSATLEWQFVDRKGRPISITDCLADCETEAISESSESSVSVADDDDAVGETCPPKKAEPDVIGCPPGTVDKNPICGAVVRAREASLILSNDPIFECRGVIVDSVKGIVRWKIPVAMSECPQVYKLQWAINDKCGRPVVINDSLLIVEGGLFGLNGEASATAGPPTLDEIRIIMRDSGPEDNPLLQDVEFSDSEILYALVRPIRQFHELPPPLRRHVFNTKMFPYREHWIKATAGHLYAAAASFYRRNRLQHSSGGMNIDDRNKEREYNNIADRMLGEWLNFIQAKKVQCNAAEAMGTVESTYGAFYRG